MLVISVVAGAVAHGGEGVLQDGAGRQLAAGLVEQVVLLPQPLAGVGDLQQGLLVVGHRSTQMGADPEGELPGQVGQIGGQGGGLADQLAGEIDHITQGPGDLAGKGLEVLVALTHRVLDPADHADAEGGVAHDVQHPEALLAEGHDVAAVVVLHLAVKDLRTAAHFRHAFVAGDPSAPPRSGGPQPWPCAASSGSGARRCAAAAPPGGRAPHRAGETGATP